MDRRKMLKVLPLAALAGAAVKIGTVQGSAFEMKPDKKYIFVLPDVPPEHAMLCSKLLRERGINATVCAGRPELKIYELQ
jgi:hypothetical protein